MALNYEDNIESFTIIHRREIVFYLRQLINEGERVSVMFEDGHESLLTVLLEVNEEDNTLIFDWGGSENTNRRLLKSPRAFFVANPLGVRNQFAVGAVWETSYNNRPAFATRIPERFVRLQRREYFRLTLPITRRPQCSFRAGEAQTQWHMAVVDIGLGGVALESQATTLPFEIGQLVPNVTIDLGKPGKLELTMEVRYVGFVSRGQKQVARLGCKFVKLDHLLEHELQRFVTQVQREERAKLG